MLFRSIFSFWGASVSLYTVGIQRIAARLADMVDIFAKHFFIMFAKHHFIIEWCLADKILPQNAQIGTDAISGGAAVSAAPTKQVVSSHRLHRTHRNFLLREVLPPTDCLR